MKTSLTLNYLKKKVKKETEISEVKRRGRPKTKKEIKKNDLEENCDLEVLFSQFKDLKEISTDIYDQNKELSINDSGNEDIWSQVLPPTIFE